MDARHWARRNGGKLRWGGPGRGWRWASGGRGWAYYGCAPTWREARAAPQQALCHSPRWPIRNLPRGAPDPALPLRRQLNGQSIRWPSAATTWRLSSVGRVDAEAERKVSSTHCPGRSLGVEDAAVTVKHPPVAARRPTHRCGSRVVTAPYHVVVPVPPQLATTGVPATASVMTHASAPRCLMVVTSASDGASSGSVLALATYWCDAKATLSVAGPPLGSRVTHRTSTSSPWRVLAGLVQRGSGRIRVFLPRGIPLGRLRAVLRIQGFAAEAYRSSHDREGGHPFV